MPSFPFLDPRYQNLFRAVAEIGMPLASDISDRLMFGTDLCRADRPVPLAGFLLEFREAGGISEGIFQKVARRNAYRLLGLDRPEAL